MSIWRDRVLVTDGFFTMRSKGSSVSAALSSSSLYSSSSHMRCRVLRGSLSSTGMDTLDKSLPMLFLKMFQRLMLLVSGHGAGRQVRRPLRKALPAKSPLATGKRIPPHQQSAHGTALSVTVTALLGNMLLIIYNREAATMTSWSTLIYNYFNNQLICTFQTKWQKWSNSNNICFFSHLS